MRSPAQDARPQPGAATPQIPRLNVRGPVVAGAIVILAIFGGGLGGAALARIDRGVGLSGTLIVETKVKSVQHQRGGVVGQLHVSDGQQVVAGQLLVTLDTKLVDEQIAALRAQTEAAQKQLLLAREEASTMAELADRKLAARSRVMSLERQVAEIEKEAAGLKARIAAAELELLRSEIRSPVAGRVLSLGVHGAGAVIQPGATVLEIVPEDDRLVLEGRLAPAHVEQVKPGMPARVWLTQSSWRESRPLEARLAWVSADAIEDRRTGQTYFTARIELVDTRAKIAQSMAVHPGMRAEILLRTGERTVLEQILDPMLRNLNRAFRA